ncbi:hypothetical protein DM01DRAFT_1381442 [Hesseltinella vesiculosa]|uniref:Uncharacterized protein n=1 Tax=Hesseltinella vesiculosa TaxID=101127 RepID=A0A1X2GPU8_9FUNG|nr:hypothetical protein DM01DRAFT_1381442 [Hesseltinella vesiculosa]
MVTMTGPLPRRSSTESEYLDINKDEAEAGSILMSLSQQTSRKPSAKPSNSMSISNLLGGNEEPSKHLQTVEIKKFETLSMNEDMHRNSETSIERPYSERQQHHALPPHPYMSEDFHASNALPAVPASVQANFGRHRSHSLTASAPAEKLQSMAYSSYTPPPAKQHSFPHPPPASAHQRGFDHRASHSQQPHLSMRNNLKVRRNALHAYISYITYSDLVRQNTNRFPIRSNSYTAHSSALIKQPVTPLPTTVDRMPDMTAVSSAPSRHPSVLSRTPSSSMASPAAAVRHRPSEPLPLSYQSSPPPASASPPQPLTAYLKQQHPPPDHSSPLPQPTQRYSYPVLPHPSSFSNPAHPSDAHLFYKRH